MALLTEKKISQLIKVKKKVYQIELKKCLVAGNGSHAVSKKNFTTDF